MKIKNLREGICSENKQTIVSIVYFQKKRHPIWMPFDVMDSLKSS